MELSVHNPTSRQLRTPAQVQHLAMVIQANLVQLRVEAQRRKFDALSRALLNIASPGAVRQFREALINRQAIKQCTDLELLFQLHENWGQFCAVQWLLSNGPNAISHPEDNPTEHSAMKCEASVYIKVVEVHAFAWRFRFELDTRGSCANTTHQKHQSDTSAASKIPATAFGKPATKLNESELRLAFCEHIGLLSTLRWVLDNQSNWLDPSLSTIDDEPFPEADSDEQIV